MGAEVVANYRHEKTGATIEEGAEIYVRFTDKTGYWVYFERTDGKPAGFSYIPKNKLKYLPEKSFKKGGKVKRKEACGKKDAVGTIRDIGNKICVNIGGSTRLFKYTELIPYEGENTRRLRRRLAKLLVCELSGYRLL